MRVLWAALNDLWQFVLGTEPKSVSFVVVAEPVVTPMPAPKIALQPRTPVLEIAESSVLPVVAAPGSAASSYTVTHSQWYVSIPRAAVHTDPVDAFDNVVTWVLYGTPVQVVERRGRWVQVTAVGVQGWVLAENVGTQDEVLPTFRVGHRYEADAPQTLTLRAAINDSFNGTTSNTMLRGVEYVTYRLWLQGRHLPWPVSHSRVAGTWQRKLRGVRGVHSDIMPHTGSVMEYIIDDVGYVAYVEKVAPDLKITVSGIGLTHEGQYTEQVWRHEAWREFHPVFIQVG